MIYSMTAFARSTEHGKWGSLVWELRSVNHRYLDLSFRMPDTLRELEGVLRARARRKLQRGKLECTLKFSPGAGMSSKLGVNMHVAKQLLEAADQIKEVYPETAPLHVMRVLSWPGVLQTQEGDISEVSEAIMTSFDKALEDLMAMRQREGCATRELIEERLQQIVKHVTDVESNLPELIANQRRRLSERFEAAQVELDPNRLEQEMVFFAQKIDVAEELDRLQTHVGEMQRVLERGGVMGRRMDFLSQELHREANTLSSKSADSAVTLSSVDLKVLIEQIREQVQNIE